MVLMLWRTRAQVVALDVRLKRRRSLVVVTGGSRSTGKVRRRPLRRRSAFHRGVGAHGRRWREPPRLVVGESLRITRARPALYPVARWSS